MLKINSITNRPSSAGVTLIGNFQTGLNIRTGYVTQLNFVRYGARGEVSNINENLFGISAVTVEGDSGGPIFLLRGGRFELGGIVTKISRMPRSVNGDEWWFRIGFRKLPVFREAVKPRLVGGDRSHGATFFTFLVPQAIGLGFGVKINPIMDQIDKYLKENENLSLLFCQMLYGNL